MKNKLFATVLLITGSVSISYAQNYGNKFMIAPDYNFNHFAIDRIGQQIYADLYGGRLFRIDLKTMAVDTTNFVGQITFGNKKHVMFNANGDTLYDIDHGTLCRIPVPDTPISVGNCYYEVPPLLSPNDSNLMFGVGYAEPYPVSFIADNYVFSLKDSSLLPIDSIASKHFNASFPSWCQWSSDTSLVFTESDSTIVEYFIGSRRIDTLVTLHNYSKIASFAYNTKENFLAYSMVPGYVGVDFSPQIYFHFYGSNLDFLAFSQGKDDSTCHSMADELTSLCWSPDNDRLGFLAFSNINEMTSIYFYLMDSSRAYRATQYCNDPDKKYALEWVNEDTLVYFDADDVHLYGMDISPVIDVIHVRKNELLPTHFSVANYPNPFNPTTTIDVTLPRNTNAVLSIYDVQGKLVREYKIKNNGNMNYKITWNAANNHGEVVASGFYLAVLKVDDPNNQNRKVTKLIYLK